MSMQPCSSRKRKRSINLTGDEEICEKPHVKFVFDVDAIDDDDDDEDDELNHQRELKLRGEYENTLRAQEPATVSDIKITPFNLDDEREEGDFDDTGNFTFRKESKKDELYDTWADSVDWESVAKNQLAKPPRSRPKPESPELVAKDKLTCYKQMLRMMKPDETVQRTIKRMGDSIPKRRSNMKKSQEPQLDATEIASLRSKLDKMIDLAHERLEDGETDIYQRSYEDLEEAIN